MSGPLVAAAAESAAVGHPLALELAVSQLLGIVWGSFGVDRDEPTAELTAALRVGLRQHGELGAAVATVLDRLGEGPRAAAGPVLAAVPSSPLPADEWLDRRPTLLDGVTARDPFGDQTNYVMSFGFLDGEQVVGEHVIVALVDHNLHLLKDAFPVIEDGGFADVRALIRQAEDLRVDDLDPQDAADQIGEAIRITDMTMDVNDILGEYTDVTWHLLKSRVATCLPAPGELEEPWDAWPDAARTKEVRAFVRSAAARRLFEGPDAPPADVVRHLATMFVNYACDYGRGSPTSWSPIAVELFLSDWAPRKVVWEDEDLPWVAPTLAVFVEWALKRDGVPVRYRRDTVAAVAQWASEFERHAAAGDRLGPAAQMVAAMQAQGVDLSDPAAIQRAIAIHNANLGGPGVEKRSPGATAGYSVGTDERGFHDCDRWRGPPEAGNGAGADQRTCGDDAGRVRAGDRRRTGPRGTIRPDPPEDRDQARHVADPSDGAGRGNSGTRHRAR
ncbi:MAG: hypothetical protein U0R64_10690 [Candidatus Nanopelagicales bacterium]